jgi:ketosteroid isomerase-like protein
MSSSEVTIICAWHDALNAGDVKRLVALSSDDVEVGGPRGLSHGAQVLQEWFGRAGIRLEPRKLFRRGATVVVEQGAEWRAGGTGDVSGRQTAASVFVVRDDRVASVIRYSDLSDAFAASGVTEADLV